MEGELTSAENEAPAVEEQTNTEDDNIPSDFFDDFAKDEFLQGLSVVDSWDDDPEHAGGQQDDSGRKVYDVKTYINKYKMVRRKFIENQKKGTPDFEDCTKPGSRRDPAKTLSAIKQDKEKKVKEILAKCLESSEDLRPPGTELDDFLEGDKKPVVKQEREKISTDRVESHRREGLEKERTRRDSPPRSSYHRDNVKGRGGHHWGRGDMLKNYYNNRSSKECSYVHRSPPSHFNIRTRSPHRPRSPSRRQYSPQHHYRSPKRRSPNRRSPARRSPVRRSPVRRSPVRRSPVRHSPVRRSPVRRSPHRRSPVRRSSPRRSPIRPSANHSPTRRRSVHRERSLPRRSPYKQERKMRSRLTPIRKKWSPPPVQDSFLYPESSSYKPAPVVNPETNWALNEPAYNPTTSNTYAYPTQPDYSAGFVQNQPFLLPTPVPVPTPVPAPVPPPSELGMQMLHAKTTQNSLEKLVADGIISKADYMKLAPTPDMSVPTSLLDVKDKVELLTRCQDAVSKLAKLHLPNRLIMLNQTRKIEPKPIMPRYCSPLKREPIVKFAFTDVTTNAADQNNMLLKRILNAVGMDTVERPKKKKNTCEIGVQTSMPFCQSCEIRESAHFSVAETSTERDYFYSSVQTQVVDKDLLNSKSLFASGGGITDGAPVSICHLTPAQLVSQLAARAKALKSAEDPAQPGADYRQRNHQHYQYGNNSHYNNNQNFRY